MRMFREGRRGGTTWSDWTRECFIRDGGSESLIATMELKDLGAVVCDHLHSSLTWVVISYWLPSPGSAGMSFDYRDCFTSRALRIEYEYTIHSLTSRETGASLESKRDYRAAICRALLRMNETEKWIDEGAISARETRIWVEGSIPDPALWVLVRQPIQYFDTCSRCRKDYPYFGSGVCYACFPPSLDFEADVDLIGKMKLFREEGRPGSIKWILKDVAYLDDQGEDCSYDMGIGVNFTLVLTGCSFFRGEEQWKFSAPIEDWKVPITKLLDAIVPQGHTNTLALQ